ncbi:tetratricopeptide repeat protein [Methylococcus sp. ANG]|uniref:tetratricopeptide repeat protein n=1 Tax=unclassified Methylococcus TaxID=2618889 RepID=UPI001C533AE8|nr:tetratricopeptide repeat protein [Methylococcus sp. Mc7]QXP84259.1 tetratricopeptide repeat protein [Methylococcus sp. Mc7]
MNSYANSRRFNALPCRWVAVALCLAVSAGCAQRKAVRPPAPSVRPAPTASPAPSPKPKAAVQPAKPAPGTSGGAKKQPAPTPAVAALMSDADKAQASGQLDNAAATLERAIRMQPRNPELWYRLATVRMAQQQPRLALDLARKCKVLAKGNPDLVQKSQTLIEEAGRLTGAAEK